MGNIFQRLFTSTPEWAQEAIREVKSKRWPVLDLSGVGKDKLVQLTTIPNDVFLLPWLQVLNLSGNRLPIIPDSIATLTNLRELNLSSNELATLPATIPHLVHLHTLILSGNRLTAVPDVIAHLTNLQSLDLSRNQLTTLPAWLADLPYLTTLHLDRNHVKTPPPEVLFTDISHSRFRQYYQVDLERLRAYFRQLAEEGEDRLFEAKLLIVGEPGAGKTSLTHKIINPAYRLTQHERSTEGIDVHVWEFDLPPDSSIDSSTTSSPEENKFRVNIWDFGGQEIYHATHQFFLTRRSLYVVVADAREQKTDFFYWLDSIEHLSEGSPVLILSNEKQDRQWMINERQLRNHFANLRENVFTINLSTNRGLKRLRQAIQYHITHLPHIGDALPRTWINVRHALENDPRPYILLTDFLAMCQENGFTRLEDKLQLSAYLHDLGVCLHFQDDPLLKKTIILNPVWGTDAVYRVLDSEQIQANLGQFNRADLSRIWHEERFALMHDELLALMMKFQLCYEIPNRPGTYIAPQLLSEQQPRYAWKPENNLFLRYKYEEFMPHGFLTRFIVVMHPYIARQRLVWRSGVVLVKGKTAAEVIEFYHWREIRIRVAGPDKRELLAVIMHELDKLHRPFHQLKYDRLIPCNCATCCTIEEPHFYKLTTLKTRLEHNKSTIECDKPPFHTVEIWPLIDGVGMRGHLIDQDKGMAFIDLTQLLHKLEKSFNDEELKQLCFELKIAYDDLPAQGRNNKMRELIAYLERIGRLSDLVELVQQHRPNQHWW